MRIILGLSLLIPNFKPYNMQQHDFKIPIACKDDFECELPSRCCKSLILDYCCTHGGHGSRIPRAHPNITWPELPDNFPFPKPQPIPIPIPIPSN